MKSVRLDEELEDRLREAARITGQPMSEIIREALRTHCDELLSDNLAKRLADVVGSVSVGGDSRRTGRAFKRLLLSRQRRRK
jgi:predicted DNA-binding protein